MADTILNASNFDTSIISYGTKKVNDRGGSSMNIMNKSIRSGLRLSTPMMLTWGACDYTDPATGESDGKYSMALQFPEEEYTNPESEAFLANMIALEAKVKNDALTKSKDWFGKSITSPDVIDALYSPMLKYPYIRGTKEHDYNRKPTLKLKIPCWKDVFNVEIYDEEGEPLFPNPRTNASPMEFLVRTNVMCIIQCGGVWFANGKFGVTWKLMQAVIQKPRETIQGKCMIKVNASDKAKLAAQPAADENEVEDNNVEMEVVPDSEDEDADPVPDEVADPVPDEVADPVPDEVAAPVAEPEPPVPVVVEKKVVRKTRAAKA